MGGYALAHKGIIGKRMSRAEYNEMSTHILERCSDFEIVEITKVLTSKTSFGDIDIIVANFEGVCDKIIDLFKTTHYIKNGDVLSIIYQNVQLDFILVDSSDVEFATYYFSYGSLGNLTGRLVKGYGNCVKFGYDGLKYVFKSQKVRNLNETIYLTKNLSEALAFLGLSYETYLNVEFDTLDFLLSYILTSPKLNVKYFDNINQNYKKRHKDREIVELEMLVSKAKDINIKNFEYSSNKDSYFELFDKTFSASDFLNKYARIKETERKHLELKAKFNGRMVMEKYGLVEAQLGEVLCGFKKHIGDRYVDYILETPLEDIFSEFEAVYLNKLSFT
jgi:hypothetical protein